MPMAFAIQWPKKNRWKVSFIRHSLDGFSLVHQGASQTETFVSEILGHWNLGYHEIRRVSDMTTSRCIPRPPLNAHGESTTSFLRACGARPAEDPRWIKFCHLIGDDRCRRFLKEHLLPMIGPRPTGNTQDETKILTSSCSLTKAGTLRFSLSSIPMPIHPGLIIRKQLTPP